MKVLILKLQYTACTKTLSWEKPRWSEDYRRVMRNFLSLNQNHVGVKSMLGQIVLGEDPMYPHVSLKKGHIHIYNT